MNCQFTSDGRGGERFVYRCKACGRLVRSRSADPRTIKATCGIAVPPALPIGVGTQFFRLCNELGVKQKSGCNCKALLREMESLGVEGCLRERERLLAELAKNLEHYTLTEKLSAAWAAIAAGLPLSLAGMLDLAIERAAADPSASQEPAASPSTNPPAHQ